MRKSKIFQFLYGVILAIFIIFGTMLMIRSVELHRGNSFYEQAAEAEKQVSAASVNSTLSIAPAVWTTMPEARECESVLPKINELSLHLSQFVGKYPETAIWLKIPDTSLDYPVMLGKDNQFYLNHLPDGRKSALGSLFLDYRTKEDSVHLIVCVSPAI